MLTAIAELAADSDFLQRVQIAALHEGVPDPRMWASEHALEVASRPFLASAYEAASLDPFRVRPGADPDVIDDDQITTAVNSVLTD